MPKSIQDLKRLWKKLSNVPVDNNDCIDVDWHIFKKGTDKFYIWHWFESQNKNFSVHDALYNCPR